MTTQMKKTNEQNQSVTNTDSVSIAKSHFSFSFVSHLVLEIFQLALGRPGKWRTVVV